MRPYKQTVLHEPSQGRFGDCERTALGCLLERDPETIPHFLARDPSGASVHEMKQEWLLDLGLTLACVVADSEAITLENLLTYVGDTNPGLHFLLCGNSRSGVGHVVVCRDGEIVHDPHPNDVGIVGPLDNGCYEIQFLAPSFLYGLSSIE